MDDDDLTPLVRDAFLALAEVLDGQPAAAWEARSLCDRWRVRDVVAHVSNAARYEPEQYIAELQADGGDGAATTDRLARRDGELDTDVLLAGLRAERLHRWVPPGGDRRGALTHVVIHGLDITTPLSVGPWVADEARRIVLDVLTEASVHAIFGVPIDGVRLEATDLDWSFGHGPVVSGAADDLILLLSGRELEPGRIIGTMPEPGAGRRGRERGARD